MAKHSIIAFLLAAVVFVAPAPRAHATVTATLSEDVTSLDIHRAYTITDQLVMSCLTEGLTRMGDDLQPHPGLAERWQVSADGRRYTFTLKAAAQWSDGKAITAQDFEHSWRRLRDPALKGRYATFLEGVIAMKALDAKTFEVTLSQPNVAFPVIVSYFPFSPARAGAKTPVWSGPFQLQAREAGKHLTLAPNERYAGAKPTDRLMFAVVANPDEALELFRQRKVQVIPGASRLQYLKLAPLGAERAKFLSIGSLGTIYLGFNFRSPLLRDAALRGILAEGVDAAAIAADMGNDDRPARAFIPLGIAGGGFESKRSFNAASAKQALAAWLKAKGLKNLRLRIIARKGHRAEVAQAVATRLTQAFGDQLQITVAGFESTPLEKKFIDGSEYDAMVGAWLADFPDGINFLDIFVTGRFQNVIHFSDKAYDDAVTAAARALDVKTRGAQMALAQKALIDDQRAMVPLFHMNTAAIVDPAVKNLKIDMLQRINLSGK